MKEVYCSFSVCVTPRCTFLLYLRVAGAHFTFACPLQHRSHLRFSSNVAVENIAHKRRVSRAICATLPFSLTGVVFVFCLSCRCGKHNAAARRNRAISNVFCLAFPPAVTCALCRGCERRFDVTVWICSCTAPLSPPHCHSCWVCGLRHQRNLDNNAAGSMVACRM